MKQLWFGVTCIQLHELESLYSCGEDAAARTIAVEGSGVSEFRV